MAAIEPFQDAVKALREFTGLVKDLKIVERWDERRRRRIADQLATLRFSTDGFSETLRKMANGVEYEPQHKEALSIRLDRTRETISRSLQRLKQSRKYIRHHKGMKIEMELDALLSESVGKLRLREAIRDLVNSYRPNSPGEARVIAIELIQRINDFNNTLATFHDKLLLN